MAISFKCSCGRELSVTDDQAGREAFCPNCRKALPVPAASVEPGLVPDAPLTAADRREASEFKPGALAQLLTDAAKPLPAAPAPAPAAPPPTPSAPAAPPPPKAGKPRKHGIEMFPDKIKFYCACGQKVSVKIPAPQSAGKCPRCKRSLEVPAAASIPEQKKAPSAHPPTDELHCPKCGWRLDKPGAAACGRCGFPLSPRPPGAAGGSGGPDQPAPAAPDAKGPPAAQISVAESSRPPDSALRKASARQAAEIAADLLRPPEAREAAAVSTQPAGIFRRLGAFLLDGSAAAGVGWLSAKTVGAADWRTSALLGAGAFLVVNEVIFASLAGARSLGMVLCRVAVVGPTGQPAHVGLLLARLFAWLILFIGAPLALFDAQRRTLHDLICGTAVHQPVSP